jgi:PAS domain S-box-containing protein
MANFIDRFLKIPNYKDNESNVVASMTQGIAIGMVLLSLMFVIAASFVAPDLVRSATVLAITFTLTTVGVITLIRTQRLQFASTLLVVVMWLAITVGSITAGGISAPIFTGYLIVILAGGLISNYKIGTMISIGCILSGILIALAEAYGLLPKPIAYTPLARLGIYIFFFVVTVLLQTFSRQNMQGLLKQAKDSEANYKSLLENIPTTTYINSLDVNAYTKYVSPQVEKLLGYPRDEFLKDPEFWKKILHAEDYERVMAANREGTNTGVPFNMEYRLITRDRRVIWVKDEAKLVRDDHGKPQYWLGVWTDITALKQAEEEQADLVSVMTKRNIQLQTAAEVSRAASSILDLNKLLPAVVHLICTHFDYYYVGIFLVDESKAWAILSAATGEIGEQMLKAGHRLKVEGSSMIGWCIQNRQARIALDVGEDAVRFKNPYLPLTRSEIALPLIAHGEPIGAMTIQSTLPAAFSRVDVTALQSMADQMANTIENARLFTERVSLIGELETRNAELEQFTYTVSHDLRSPLVTIRGFLGYLRQDAASNDMLRFDKDLNRISNAVDRMQLLLNDLLELSRIGRVINPSESVPFGDVVAEAVELLHGPLEKHNVKLIAHKNFPNIFGDHARLVEVLQNLINNAAKFMGDQPQPTVEIGMDSDDANQMPVFFVRDNGIGIDPQYHDRIFGLFNRLDPSVEGTGIGLALVKRIIEMHGGRIWIESKPGEGSTFYFTLPRN